MERPWRRPGPCFDLKPVKMGSFFRRAKMSGACRAEMARWIPEAEITREFPGGKVGLPECFGYVVEKKSTRQSKYFKDRRHVKK